MVACISHERGRDDPRDSSPAAATGASPGDLSGLRVLFVDDEPGVRRLVTAALDRLHAEGTVVASPVTALHLVEEDPGGFDVVITDYRMPEMDGGELFHELHALAPALPVVITSGFAEDRKVRECLAQGAAGFLPKPFTIALFVETVHRSLGGGGR